MHSEYEVLYKISKKSSRTFNTASSATKIQNLEKRMKDIKKRKICHTCDQTWCNKLQFSSKVYDTWYSPLNEKALKNDSTYINISKCDYQSLVDLLFTNGELDIDKVICLHVLASHPCDKLILPLPTNCHIKFETQTALEKLIERSSSFCGYRSGMKYNLPIYVLNVNEERRQYSYSSNRHIHNEKYSTVCMFEDGRLATRLVINKNLLRLVQTVIEALHHCNPPKMVYLLKVVNNVNYVRHIINKPQLQPFIKALSSQKIVLSSDSFLLTRPFETCIELTIENPNHNLQILIQKIRNRVLNDQNYENQKEHIDHENSKKNNTNLRDLKHEIDVYLNFHTFDAEKISSILNAKIKEAHEKDVKKMRRSMTANSSGEDESAVSHLRKHHCYACTEKWRNHLISDKNLQKRSNETDHFKVTCSHSTQYLKLIIQEEENNLSKLKIKNVIPSLSQLSERPLQKKPMVLNLNKKKYSKTQKSLSNTQANPNSRYAENNLNLAKIRNEISMKENRKRIKKFLDEPIYAKKITVENSDYSIIPI